MVAAVGLPGGFHFHDLRHIGNQLAAASGATTRELMQRMGHGSMRAALVYQHATSVRDRSIAAAMSELVAKERQSNSKPDEANGNDSCEEGGPAGTLVPVA